MDLLSHAFVNSYRGRTVNWGFQSGPNRLGELVYRRTYRRGTETWPDTVARVVNGVFGVILDHLSGRGMEIDHPRMAGLAEEMFERIFTFKFLPPGRGLWLMGTEFAKTRGGAGLNNCGFVSTKNIAAEGSKPFEFLMDMSMLGVGVGFDTEGAGKVSWAPHGRSPLGRLRRLAATKSFRTLWAFRRLCGVSPYVIPDTREGWVEATARVIRWGLGLGPEPLLDYSLVRPYGAPINGFGGVASGPGPLVELHQRLKALILARAGQPVSARDIVDVMNMIGACVVAGNVRRTAEIAFGDPDDEAYLDLKDYEKNPERGAWGWTSNNSVFARVGMNYGRCAARTRRNGEPGYGWLENMRAFGRMADPANWLDYRVAGGNPCLEQSLEPYELCCLVETFPWNHETLADYERTLELAWLYAKAVTLVMTHCEETNEVMRRNRRVGCSVSGVAQFIHGRGAAELARWLDAGYRFICQWDTNLSGWWGVPESIKKTSVKPSGTVSLLAGATPGCHYPTMNTYIRRVRYAKGHPDIEPLVAAGYKVEPSIVGYRDYETMSDPVYDPNTVVVEFPVDAGEGSPPTEQEVSLADKVGVAVLLQHWWADNQVSCTASFRPEEGDQIEGLLAENDRKLKGISFLPLVQEKAYPQMPYEAITREAYARMAGSLRPVVWPEDGTHAEEERGCEGGLCSVGSRT
jgi:ribonucleoside-triphosphate reductase